MESEETLAEILTVDGMVEAEILKLKLESFEIPCMLKFESIGRLTGISMNGLGKVKLIVPKSLIEKALEIIQQD